MFRLYKITAFACAQSANTSILRNSYYDLCRLCDGSITSFEENTETFGQLVVILSVGFKVQNNLSICPEALRKIKEKSG
jgi:hypothetical protein